MLIYDRWAYPIARLAAGGTLSVDKQLEPQTAETYLRRVTVQDEKSIRAPYDRSSADVKRIMEMLLFYELAGGEVYTGLTHRAQNFIDLSNHVRMGQAILLVRATEPASAMLRNDEPLAAQARQQETYYRFLLPVTQGEPQAEPK